MISVSLLFIQVLCSALPRRSTGAINNNPLRLAVLIPAHNEAETISDTLNSIQKQLKNEDRLLVVADNCTDETAAVASRLGAEVVERVNPDERGKGFALDFGVNALRDFPPEVLIIVDADCIVEDRCLDKLVRSANSNGCPAQALYLMSSKENKNPTSQFAEFAWIVKNWLRPLGYKNMGFPCQLMGTGMAFPWRIISNANLKSDSIVEDMQLGVDLAIAGYPAVFCPEARVSSEFPTSSSAEKSQRIRWEHGHLSVLIKSAPKLLIKGITKRNTKLVALALDLAIPPLTFLALILFFIFIVELTLIGSGLSAPSLRTIAILILLVLFAASIMIAWWIEGRKVIPLTSLLKVPVYVVKKIPIYIKFFLNKQRDWVRTDRKH